MKKCNCIVIFDKTKSHILFCKRVKSPYAGKHNFIGGKVESGEDDLSAAYRELQEETGISQCDIQLFHLMDITYYYSGDVCWTTPGKYSVARRIKSAGMAIYRE